MSNGPEQEKPEGRQLEPEQKDSKPTLRSRLRLIFLTSVLLGSVGLTVYQLVYVYKDLEGQINEVFGQQNFVEFDPNQFNEAIKNHPEVLGTFHTQQAINLFNQKTQELSGAFFEFAKRPNTEESLETFRQIAIEHLFEGLTILNKVNKNNFAEYINKDGNSQVKIDKQTYDLNNPFEFQLAFATTSLKLDEIYIRSNLDSQKNQDAEKQIKEVGIKNKLDQEAILWLKNQKLKTGFLKDSILFVNPRGLTNFARTLRIINQLGYPAPRTGFFSPNTTVGGRFLEKDWLISEHTIIDYSDRSGLVDSLGHELGHYVAKTSEKINPEFSQNSFNKVLEKAESENLGKVRNLNNLYYSLPLEVIGVKSEQYAEFFQEYLIRGEDLRQEISQLHNDDPAAARILEAQYNFFKKLFKGKEFVKDGLTADELTLKSETQESYQVGESVIINDKDEVRPGVLLRRTPTGPIYTDAKGVFDGDGVEIILGPVITKKQVWNEEGKPYLEDVRWWKVRVRFRGTEGFEKVGSLEGEGWIEEKWLGEKY